MRTAALCLMLLLTAACGRGVPGDARVVVAGDSVFAWNRIGGGSVAQEIEAALDEPVGDLSLPFARVLSGTAGLNIQSQVDGLSREWVILTGGANDLRSNCGCTGCDAVLDRLISENGRDGAIPQMVAGLRERGARVIWASYYTSPRFDGTACVRPYDILEARLERMAASDGGVRLVDMGSVLPAADRALFAEDGVHPSEIGSARIADLIVRALRAADASFRP